MKQKIIPQGLNLPWPVKIFYYLLYGISCLLFRPQFSGLENLPPTGPYYLVANHQSNFDVVLLTPCLPNMPRWLAKEALFENRFSSWLMHIFQAIPINRQGLNLAGVKEIFRSLKAGQPVALFPEATRLKLEDIGKRLPSASVIHLLEKSGNCIVPAYINVPYRLFHKNQIVFGESFYLDSADSDAQKIQLLIEKIYGLSGQSIEELRGERDA